MPVRAYAAPSKKGLLSRLLFGERDDAPPAAAAESAAEAAPTPPEQPAAATSKAAAAAAASAAEAARLRRLSEKERDELMNADLEKLGRDALKDQGDGGDEVLNALRHRGQFTLNEFLFMLQHTPKQLQVADMADVVKVLEAMSAAQRKANVLLNPTVLAALGPQLAKKAGVAPDVPQKLVTQYQTVEAVQEAIRKWQERGEPIPKTMAGIQEKAMRDGSFNHIISKLRASAKQR